MSKLNYENIKLGGKILLPEGYRHLGPITITGIDNLAILDNINEPIFTGITANGSRWTFGLKYTLKNYQK
jgi:hypothetical protein